MADGGRGRRGGLRRRAEGGGRDEAAAGKGGDGPAAEQGGGAGSERGGHGLHLRKARRLGEKGGIGRGPAETPVLARGGVPALRLRVQRSASR